MATGRLPIPIALAIPRPELTTAQRIAPIPTASGTRQPPGATVVAPPHKPTVLGIPRSEFGNTLLQDNSLTLGYDEKFS